MRVLPLLLATCVLICWLLLLLFRAPTVQAQNNAPTLVIATGIQATAGHTVTVPIDFRNNGRSISSLAFALAIDPACLPFDPVDHNGDHQPDAVTFHLPSQLRGSTNHNPATGQLEIVIADYAPPLATLPDTDGLIRLTFNVNCAPEAGQTIAVPVNFSSVPPASFSDPQGKTVAGLVTNGLVIINPPDGPMPTPTLTPTPSPVPTMPPLLSLAVNVQAAPTAAQAGDTITYTYQMTNTGEVSITLAAVDNQLGQVLLTTLVGSGEQTPLTWLAPGQFAVGAGYYTVQPCDAAGPLVNTITVTGTTASAVVFTVQASASVTLHPLPVLPPFAAVANTIYTGCAIQLSIAPTETRSARTYHMVVVAGPPPADLVLSGVQHIYPYTDLESMVEQSNALLSTGCVNDAPCNTVQRVLFGYSTPYQIEMIQTLEQVTTRFLPFARVECLLSHLACKPTPAKATTP